MIGGWNACTLKTPNETTSIGANQFHGSPPPPSPVEGRNSVAAVRAPGIPSHREVASDRILSPETGILKGDGTMPRCGAHPRHDCNAWCSLHRGGGDRRVWTSSCTTTIEISKRPHRCGGPRILWISARSAFETREYHILVPTSIRWFSYAPYHTRLMCTCEFSERWTSVRQLFRAR